MHHEDKLLALIYRSARLPWGIRASANRAMMMLRDSGPCLDRGTITRVGFDVILIETMMKLRVIKGSQVASFLDHPAFLCKPKYGMVFNSLTGLFGPERTATSPDPTIHMSTGGIPQPLGALDRRVDHRSHQQLVIIEGKLRS